MSMERGEASLRDHLNLSGRSPFIRHSKVRNLYVFNNHKPDGAGWEFCLTTYVKLIKRA